MIVYQVSLTLLLLLTVLFANFAEALAEARGKAQADSLRATRQDTPALRLDSMESQNGELVPSTKLRPGDLVLVEAGQVIPADGEVVAGVASVDESAITGESAPVIREAGGDRSGVTGGTRVLSDRIVVQVTAAPPALDVVTGVPGSPPPCCPAGERHRRAVVLPWGRRPPPLFPFP